MDGGLIVLAAMAAWVLFVYRMPGSKNFGKQKEDAMNKNFYDNGEVMDVGDSFSDSVSERSLSVKHDKALERASRKARLGWKDRKELRKLSSQNLVELTRDTSDDMRDALRAKFRSDLDAFVAAHRMRNMARVERLRLSFEDALTEAYAESSRNRMGIKMKALMAASEAMSRRLEDSGRLSSQKNGAKYSALAGESFERVLAETMREIETIKVRFNTPELD